MTLEQQQAIAMAAARMRLANEQEQRDDPRANTLGKIDTAVRGIADTLTLGAADELSAAGDAVLYPLLGTGAPGENYSDRYAANLKKQRDIDTTDSENRFGYRLGGQLAGGIAGGVGLAKNGLSLAANTLARGGSLAKTAGASAVETSGLSALHGFGSGESLSDRADQALTGGVFGLGLGAVAPYAVAGAATAAKPILAPILSRLKPEEYAETAIADGLRRSGYSPTEITTAMREAASDGQGVFNLADAMGNAGQRMLSTAARVPHGERQNVIENLQSRQAGQGRRISGALADAFDAPDTAAQRVARLGRERDAAANISYGAARQEARPVDVTSAIATIDEVLEPGFMKIARPQSSISDDSIEGALSKARNMLTDGKSNLTDFSSVLRAKQDLDDMIGRAANKGSKNQVRLLSKVRNEIDGALEAASAPYAGARDSFRQQSKAIDAVEAGSGAATRGRADDTIEAFRNLSPEEQAAFRAGYADPLIGATQSAASGVNKARPLITDATAREFPEFAAPGKGAQLERRVGREMRMFETTNAALGGSKTADNLADAAEMAKFDPGILTKLLHGRPIAAVTEAVTRALSSARGQPPAVIERIAKALTETRPDVVQNILDNATSRSFRHKNMRALLTAITENTAASAAGRMN